jgi:hypothetical protein
LTPCYNVDMAEKEGWTTIRVRETTRKTLKIAAAAADWSMADVVDEAICEWIWAHQRPDPRAEYR